MFIDGVIKCVALQTGHFANFICLSFPLCFAIHLLENMLVGSKHWQLGTKLPNSPCPAFVYMWVFTFGWIPRSLSAGWYSKNMVSFLKPALMIRFSCVLDSLESLGRRSTGKTQASAGGSVCCASLFHLMDLLHQLEKKTAAEKAGTGNVQTEMESTNSIFKPDEFDFFMYWMETILSFKVVKALNEMV